MSDSSNKYKVDNFVPPYNLHLQSLFPIAKNAGVSDGGLNRPATADTHAAEESDILIGARTLLTETAKHYNDRIRTQQEKLDEIEKEVRSGMTPTQFDNIIQRCGNELNSLFTIERIENLTKHKTSALTHLAHLNEFKHKNGLKVRAVYPSSMLQHFTVLTTIAVAEALMNINFYGDYRNLQSAILLAFGASIANVGVSVFAGTWLRFKNSVIVGTRRLGWLTLMLWGLYAFHLNKYLAMFRCYLEIANDKTAGQVLDQAAQAAQFTQANQNAFYSTFSLNPGTGLSNLDPISWFLLIIGFMASVAALIKGYRADDTYPEYGAKSRLYDQEEKACSELEQQIRKDAEVILQGAESQLTEIENVRSRALEQFRDMAALHSKTTENFRRDSASIDSDYRDLITLYREENKKVRAIPSPTFFETQSSLRMIELHIPDRWKVEALEKTEAELNDIVTNTISTCSSKRAELNNLRSTNSALIEKQLAEIKLKAESKAHETPKMNRAG